jgi:hypothetical protein
MEVHVLPIARRPARGSGSAGRVGGEVPPARLAEVHSLDARRRARRDEIPHRVLEEVRAAARMVEDLAAAGHEVRFTTHGLSGRIVAQLCDLDGNVVRSLSLFEALNPPIDLDPDTAA